MPNLPRYAGTATVLAGVALLWSAPAGADTPGVTLLPHHAVYKLSLATASGSKAPADASGMISYDFSGSACKGWKTVFQQVTEIEPPEGEARLSNTETTTVESGSGSTFDFDIKTASNHDEDDIRGEASKTAGGSVEIDLKQPDAARIDLKTAVLFPTEHLSRIIEAARAGRKILPASVFDGSDTGRKVFNTLSVIGAPISSPAAEQAAQTDALKSERRWPVTISYFEQGDADAPPAYVLSFELYENGVSRALKVNYGSFTLAGDLVELKTSAAAPCAD